MIWNTTVLVENKAGAAGIIAADYVAKQPSDGSTLLMAHINNHAIAPALTPKMTYNVESDFTPVVLVGVTPNLLICNEQQQARSVKDMVELCRKNPGKMSFGSVRPATALRSTWRLRCSSWRLKSMPFMCLTRALARC